jgi:uncharacterized membrane protein YfhO
MASPTFDPKLAAVMEENYLNLFASGGVTSPVPSITARSLNKISIDAQSSGPGLLVLGDTYYPGWKAFVNGKESRIYRVNHAMRGVVVAGGRQSVEFRYEPASFLIGAVISSVSVVALVGLLICFKPRSGYYRVAD